MKKLQFPNRDEWRNWLRENHDREPSGIWLVYYKKAAAKSSLDYEESLQEALCYGWIDSIIRRIDDHTYCRKFTPRKDRSRWSGPNRRRVEKLIQEGRMQAPGLVKVEAAKRNGMWHLDARPTLSLELPQALADALARDNQAKSFFAGLAPSYRRHFIGWIVAARRPATRAARLKEAITLLRRGEKLGLK